MSGITVVTVPVNDVHPLPVICCTSLNKDTNTVWSVNTQHTSLLFVQQTQNTFLLIIGITRTKSYT